MDEQDRFVIALSAIGPTENISSETVRRKAKQLESDGLIAIQHTPYGRGLVTISGYKRLRELLLSGNHRAA